MGRNHWRKQCIHTTGIKLASVTDEALGLLILDNCWVCWCLRSAGPDKPDVMVEALATVDPSVTTGVDWESLSKEKQILARKTRAKAVLGLTKYTTRAAGTKGTGWSEEGLDKFNKLCKQVAENRASDKGRFDEYYMQHKKETVHGKPSRRAAASITKELYDDFSD